MPGMYNSSNQLLPSWGGMQAQQMVPPNAGSLGMPTNTNFSVNPYNTNAQSLANAQPYSGFDSMNMIPGQYANPNSYFESMSNHTSLSEPNSNNNEATNDMSYYNPNLPPTYRGSSDDIEYVPASYPIREGFDPHNLAELNAFPIESSEATSYRGPPDMAFSYQLNPIVENNSIENADPGNQIHAVRDNLQIDVSAFLKIIFEMLQDLHVVSRTRLTIQE